MKKELFCMMAATAMLFATVKSYAAGSYDTTDNVATFSDAAGKRTVLIYKGNVNDSATSENIVYVDQASNTFEASTQFLLKNTKANGIEDGIYTVKFGSIDGTAATASTFYIGMINTGSDVELQMITGQDGYYEVGGKYNIGYTATVDISKGYQSIIIKKTDGLYMGCTIPSILTGTGLANIGLQINGVNGTLDEGMLIPEIAGVWLSTRGIN